MHAGKWFKQFFITTLVVSLLAVQLLLAPVSALRVQAAPVTFPDGTVFDPEYYAETYPDVKAAFGNDAAMLWLHYRMFGEKEGRRAAENAVPGASVSAPAGVQVLPVPDAPAQQAAPAATAASPAAPAAAAENVTFDPVFYANRYADLKAAFGNDAAKLWQHYLLFGEKEGRQAAANHVPGTKVSAPAQQTAPAAPVFRPGGRRVAFVGDSITTFAGRIPQGYATYYPKGDLDLAEETWWFQVSARAGLQVVLNASWSGSCVSGDRNDTSGAVASGLGRIRTVVAQQPDIVFIMMGVNDFGWSIKPEFFRECYHALTSQLRQALPNSLIVCCTCLPQFDLWKNDLGYDLETYNSIIRQVAGETGCYMIDTATCGLTRSHMVDNELHPNVTGATVVANYILAHMPPLK